MTHYLNQTKTQAAASLREFLDERARALDHLRESIASDVRNPYEILDGTVESPIRPLIEVEDLGEDALRRVNLRCPARGHRSRALPGGGPARQYPG